MNEKNIVLIGGSYGIGRAIAQQQSQLGNPVWIASRSMEEPMDGCHHIHFDARDENPDLSAFPEHIDTLIYCPGSINLRPFSSLKLDDFHTDMEINFFSMVRIVQSLIGRMKGRSGASILLFSSVAAQIGLPFHTSISAAKAAVEGFAKALAAEMAPAIRVNVISPSLTDTSLAKKLLSSEKSREQNASRHPLKRIGSPEDIAHAVGYFISDRSGWVTGQVLHVDGGMSTLKL